MIPAGVRIFVCTEPVDTRYGFDRLAQLARERVGQDPVEGGALFVFAGKSATRLKVLWFDRGGGPIAEHYRSEVAITNGERLPRSADRAVHLTTFHVLPWESADGALGRGVEVLLFQE